MNMTPFKRKVMLPGMLALLLSGLSIWPLYVLGMGERIWVVKSMGLEVNAVVFFVPWFICLPFIGGVGAWLARRHGASVAQRMLAAMFPTLPNFAIMALIGLIIMTGLIVHVVTGRPAVPRSVVLTFLVTHLAMQFVCWVIAPAVFALLGALPFLGSAPPAPDLGQSAHA